MTNHTEFAMWYHSSKTGKALNPDNVWTNYTGVWHFAEDYGTETGSVNVYDSTTSGIDVELGGADYQTPPVRTRTRRVRRPSSGRAASA